MENTPHPSAFIKPEWNDLIGRTASEAEQLGALHPEQLDLIRARKWFKALMPLDYGGLNLSLPQLVRLQEGLSWADGSFGWVFTLCCGAGWFAGFIDPELGKKIFTPEATCLAGSGASTGEANITDEGYMLNGQWNYASGAHHATHFTANCVIKNGGKTLLDENGIPLVLPFIIDQKDVTLLSTWKYIGMIATGSHSFKIENLHVDKNRCFKIDAGAATIYSRLYHYPFLQLAEATLAANISGMAIHFLDIAENIIEERTTSGKFTTGQEFQLKNKLARIRRETGINRDSFYTAVSQSWEGMAPDLLNQVSSKSRALAKTAIHMVDELYPYCGLQAASPESEINRVWRDVHTASQHSLLTFES